jgi:carboxynorspermidine decarboxylase
MEKYSRPTHIFSEKQFDKNLHELVSSTKEAGLRVLLALKGYNPIHSKGIVSRHCYGIAVSSLYEAKIAKMTYEGEIHTYLPAYDDDTFEHLMEYTDVVVFNSHSDLQRFGDRVPKHIKIDIRVNIQHENTQAVVFDGYNPNLPFCRFGITREELLVEDLERYNVTGIHFHALNSQGSKDLSDALDSLERKFGHILPRMERLNMGGGHKVCTGLYDYEKLSECVKRMSENYGLNVYIEPSEFVYTNVGVLKAKVLSILKNECNIAILNVSAKNHMPDLLESPYYHAEIEEGTHGRGEAKYTYTLGGNTCLTGDVIGDYSFDAPLKVGDTITFLDQTAYTSVQSHHFNGVAQPDIIVLDEDGNISSEQRDSFEAYCRTLTA